MSNVLKEDYSVWRARIEQVFEYLAIQCHNTAVDKGWWEKPRSKGDMAALFHSEISEWFEAARKDNPSSKKILDFTSEEEEIADLLVRLFDFLGSSYCDYNNVVPALLAKMTYNLSRPYRHGGKKY